MRTITRFRRDPMVSLLATAVVASFLSGAGVALLATLPPIAVPAVSVPCQDVPDVIGCLIEGADEEASSPQ